MINQKPTREELKQQIRDLEKENRAILKALRELEDSEYLHRITLEKISDTVLITDDQGKIVYVCPNAKIIFGLSQSKVYRLGTIRKLLDGMVFNLSDLKSKNEITNIEWSIRDKSGHEHFLLINIKSVKIKNGTVLYVMRDITEFKRGEEERDNLKVQLHQAQKMEAIGTLAGGIAHDFNNLLMGIQGRASLISMDLDPAHPVQEHTKAIEKTIRSAANLTKQLLGFARGGKYEVRPVDINGLVAASAAMFGRTHKEIRVHLTEQPEPMVAEADRRQIEQVLLNIFVNAWQAMADGGELYLATSVSSLTEEDCSPHQIKAGRYVKISITDTGIGMDERTRQRIFDPFFTTKTKGRGTGLGLASAYGIIKNHGGIITVDSEVGRGATFNIYLPVSEQEPYKEVSIRESLIKGSETILLVDDEAIITDATKVMLEKLGYQVMVAKSGEEAVDAVLHKGDEIDLVILDLIMPGMDGGKAFDHIREIKPSMPVILASGYGMNEQVRLILQRGCNRFIQKPFNISKLSQNIRIILEEVKPPNQQ